MGPRLAGLISLALVILLEPCRLLGRRYTARPSLHPEIERKRDKDAVPWRLATALFNCRLD